MAYTIVKNLAKLEKQGILDVLMDGVQKGERIKAKKHQAFRLSFDARLCYNETMIEQKIAYIHANPVRGKWQLVEDFTEYPHSSAAYYELGKENKYITHYKNIPDY